MHAARLRKIALFVAVATTVWFGFLLVGREFSDAKSAILSALLYGGLGLLYVLVFLRELSANPSPITIALIGPPGSGKTTYLAQLARALPLVEAEGVQFSPFMSDAFRVAPAMTPVRPSPYYTLGASTKVGSARFTVQLADFAGEVFRNIDPSRGSSEKPRQVLVQSNALLLFVDGAFVGTATSGAMEGVEATLAETIRFFRDHVGVVPSRRLDLPLAIVVSKSDLLQEAGLSRDPATVLLSPLTSLAEAHFSRSQLFFVSVQSTPSWADPISEPLVWSVRASEQMRALPWFRRTIAVEATAEN